MTLLDPSRAKYLRDPLAEELEPVTPTHRLLELLGLTSHRGFSFAILVLSPGLVYAAWNVLALGQAVGLGPMQAPALVATALFLAAGFWGRMILVGVAFIVSPAWWDASARLHWPSPDAKTFLALGLMLLVAGRQTTTA
jgi:hypothetical protein